MASSHQVLDNDVLWHAAKDLTSARDSLSIGLASSSIWNVIRTELYRAATTLEQQQALDTRLHHSRMPAIHFSIRNGYNSTTESLMQAAKTHWPGYLDVVWGPGLTPLHLAAATGNTEVVKDLHMEGCVLNAEVYLPTGRTQIFDKGPNLPELSRLYRYQLLHSPYWWEQVDSLNLAIIHKQPDIAQYLLNHMDLQRPSLPNDEPLSPLHVAALVGDAKMVETLLSLNYPLETTRLVDNATRQETALHYAAAHQGDNTTVLSLLLASGASLATTAMSSTTALETAFRNPTSPANARFLLDYSIQTDDLQISDWDSTIRWALDDSHMLPPLQALMNNPVVSSESMQSILRHLISQHRYDEDTKSKIMFLTGPPPVPRLGSRSPRCEGPDCIQVCHLPPHVRSRLHAHGAQRRVEVSHLCRKAGDGALAAQAA